MKANATVNLNLDLKCECANCGAHFDVEPDRVIRAFCEACRNQSVLPLPAPVAVAEGGSRFYSVREACRELSISRWTLQRLRKQDEINTYDLNGKPRFLRSDVRALAQRRKKQA